MLKIAFASIHPDFINSYLGFGVFGSAQKKRLAEFGVINLRDFAIDARGSVDDRPYGGGDGMIMRPEPLADCVKSLGRPLVILPSAQGQVWNQSRAAQVLAKVKERPDGVIFVCGRFGGVDQRFIERYVDLEISLGDFIISGGELASLAVADSLLRLIPGVLGHEDSAEVDSFSDALQGRLEFAQYTRPSEFEGIKVPEVLQSGDHAAIARWRLESSINTTKLKRPDLL